MSKYTTKSFTGNYSLVIMDSANNITRLRQKIDLNLSFHNGVIDADSNGRLLDLIEIIEIDLKNSKKLISAHWYEGKVEYLEKDAQEHTIDSHTYPINTRDELQEFVSYLKSLAVENKFRAEPKLFTPLLDKTLAGKLQPEATRNQVEETSILARGCKLLRCCFGY